MDLLTQRDFVCCFCLASKTLSLLRDVERLKQELKEIHVNMAAAGKQTAINHGEDKLMTEDDAALFSGATNRFPPTPL